MRWIRVAGAGCAMTVLLGCGYEARRSGQGTDYAKYVYALYDESCDRTAWTTSGPRFPVNVAVAEIGELAPPGELIDGLRADTRSFRRVVTIPGISDGDFHFDPYARDTNYSSPNSANLTTTRTALRRLERLARDTGMDYLLLVGATVDSRSHPTPASILDLTIVGAYVVPSNDVSGQARASAILIDVRTEQVLMTSSASATDTTYSPSISDQGTEDHLIRALRDEVYQRLTKQILADARRRASAR